MSTSNRTRALTRSSRTRVVSTIVGALVAVVLSVLGIGVVANAADRIDISITDTFSPANVTIAVGTTVTWTNNDTQQHELRSTSGPLEFRTDPLDPGQSATFTFATPGTYTYVDHRNSGSAAYQGTIVVSDSAPPATVTPVPPGSPTPPPVATPPAPLTASVHLAGARFAPATITVAVGATVTWVNDDGSKHTVTADNASFDSGSLNAGASFVHTFTVAGTYAYGCDFHGNMRGTVIVAGASGGSTPPPAAPPATQPPATPPPAITPPAATPPAAPGTPAAPSNVSVNIANNQFSPATITVSAGSTVTWSNGDTVTHTVTADDQSFASGLVKKATSWSHTFATPGTFTYFCEIHPEMTATVIATAPNGAAPPAAAAVTATGATATGATSSGAASTGGTASTGAASGSITINDSGFTPASFRVTVGGTVTFANNGKAMHTVTASNGSFDSSMIKSGGTWAHTFTTAGSFTYACILHPNMRGTINVGSFVERERGWRRRSADRVGRSHPGRWSGHARRRRRPTRLPSRSLSTSPTTSSGRIRQPSPWVAP